MGKIGFILSIIMGIAFAIASFTPYAQVYAQERITSDVKVMTKAKLSNKEKRALSQAAGRLLKHVHQARLSIKRKDDAQAVANIEKALQLAQIIENAAPHYEVTASIKAGNITYQDNEQVKQLLIPIYAELDEVTSCLAPVRKAKKEAAAAQSETPSPVGEMDLQYTSVVLDVGEAKYTLENALSALQKNDPDRADKALASIQEDVIFEYDELDLPLTKARWHLMEAVRHATDKEYKEAKQSLEKSATALESYTGRMGEDASKKARALAEDIKGWAGKMEEKKEGAAETITAFWQKVVNWF
jgi:cellobiose-specific phosphotransferase system component IIA